MSHDTLKSILDGPPLTEERRLLRETVRGFVNREWPKAVARELEAGNEYPHALARSVADAGFNGIGIPERYGGQGGDIVDQVIVCEELARSLAGLTWVWGITAWSGAKAVLDHGSAAQRAELLPAIADGRVTFAFALTEPEGGTDVLRAMRTHGRRVEGGFILNGAKVWATAADEADRIMVVARTAVAAKPSDGITVFLVRRDSSGLSAAPLAKLGMRSLRSCQVTFDDVFVPDSDVLGIAGDGWRQITGSLDSERIMAAAVCIGIQRGVLEDAMSYALQRSAFGKPLGALQVMQHGIVDVAMRLESSRLLTYHAASLQSEGKPCDVAATMAKVSASEAAVAAADFGIQLLGGQGYSMDFDMQRYWRDARLYRIGPISNEMARNHVGEKLGLPRSF